MKRRIVSIALICMMVVTAVAGCGSKEAPATAEEAATEAGEDSAATEEAKEEQAAESADETADTAQESGEEESAGLNIIDTGFYFNEYHGKDGTLSYECQGNHILCAPWSEKSFPGLAGRLQELADSEDKELKQIVSDSSKDASDFSEEMSTPDFSAYFYYNVDEAIRRADEKCISLLRYGSVFEGGAHPSAYYETYNIDPQTGDDILLSDVVSDDEALTKMLKDKLTKEYPDVPFFGLDESLAEYRINPASGTDEFGYIYTFEPDGITFYFPQYALCPYAYGVQIVKVLYSEAGSLIKRDMSGNTGFISYLVFDENAYGAGDGSVMKVSVDRYNEDGYNDGYYTSIIVTKDGESTEIKDSYYYNLDSFYVHTDDNKNYVYVITTSDNDYKALYVFSLDGEKPEEVKDGTYMSYGFDGDYDEEKDMSYTLPPLEPSDMLLNVRCDLLSTYGAVGHYKVSESGAPELTEDYLTVMGEHELTSKAELKADIVDEDGNTVEKDAAIPAGETYTLYRTDPTGKKFVDAKLSDGRIARLNVSGSYPHVVNDGLSEEDLFEMLYYAG
jgi:hypothetical protein